MKIVKEDKEDIKEDIELFVRKGEELFGDKKNREILSQISFATLMTMIKDNEGKKVEKIKAKYIQQLVGSIITSWELKKWN